MNKVMQHDLMNQYKIFSTKYYNSTTSETKNIKDLLSELRNEFNYWYKIDETNAFSNGISTELQKIITIIEEIIDEDISENNMREKYIFSDYVYQKLNGKANKYLYSNSNSIISFNFLFFNRHFEDIKKIKEGYIFCLKNYNQETLNILYDLYRSHTTIGNVLYHNKKTNEYKAAILFLNLETKSFRNINKLDVVDDQIITINDDLNSVFTDISNARNELTNFASKYKTDHESWINEKERWFAEKENEISDIKEKHQKRMDELEKTYNEKLKLEAPVIFWEEKSEEQHKNYNHYLIVSSVFSLIILLIGFFLVKMLYEISFNGNEYKNVIPFSFVVIAVVSLLIYLLRMFIKIMLSSKHLQTEYQQKANFTYFYLSLLNDQSTGKQITETEKNLIFNNLFSNPDTGLIKGTQDNTDIMSYLSAIISRDNH